MPRNPIENLADNQPFTIVQFLESFGVLWSAKNRSRFPDDSRQIVTAQDSRNSDCLFKYQKAKVPLTQKTIL